MTPHIIRNISGDYQHAALHRGNAIQKFWHQYKITLVKQLLPVSREEMTLDIGCGSGNYVLEFASKCKAIYGMDILQSATLFAHRSARTSNVQNVDCMQASAQHIPFLDNSIDKVLFLDIIEHLKEPQEALVELARILKPKGKALITTPNPISIWPIVEYAADILGIGMCRRFVEHETKLTSRQLIRTVREAGLVVLKMRSAYFLSPFAAMVFGSVSKKLFEIEIRQRNPFGMLLYCLVEKPQASRKSI